MCRLGFNQNTATATARSDKRGMLAPPKPLSDCALLLSRAIASAPAGILRSSRQSPDQVTLWRSTASTAVMPGSTGLLPCQLDSYSSTQQTSVIRYAQGVAQNCYRHF